jgi:hypothetical protein
MITGSKLLGKKDQNANVVISNGQLKLGGGGGS